MKNEKVQEKSNNDYKCFTFQYKKFILCSKTYFEKTSFISLHLYYGYFPPHTNNWMHVFRNHFSNYLYRKYVQRKGIQFVSELTILLDL